MTAKKYVVAIDQGTTSTRCILYNHDGDPVCSGQFEHEQIFPERGWVEHDPMEIWNNTRRAVGEAMASGDINVEDIAAVGITNQRETTVVWDKNTGEPVYNAIVWQDTRTTGICKELAGDEGPDKWRQRTGLVINSYPAGPKVKWILDNVEGARERAEKGDLLFGTIDSWLLWNLTGGADGDAGEEALHATDVTNASRTLMMDIKTLKWDEELCEAMGIPMSMLPEIRPSMADFRTARVRGALPGVPIRAILGDQQAAMFGQGCFRSGSAKNTYGTGLFLLLNTGTTPKFSDNGLLTTVCFQREGERPVYALEGSVSMGGSLVQWLRDNLQLIPNAASVENMAREVKDNGGVYIVPAFSGLFAPYWRPDARGVIVGLTRYANRNHLARAVLEATAYQTRDVADAMVADSGVDIKELRVDGGMTHNELLMQFQADILGVEVHRPKNVETTATGAAFAAGIGANFWDDLQAIANQRGDLTIWKPKMEQEEVDALYKDWKRAVRRSLDWEEAPEGDDVF
ncbi:Glycerol kinase [Corynebacterium camporealensis]|uniref:Glycerol kinase n=2 Tax=Corynebacterium TaxID=1716 RepID=A0A4P7QK77_9CORY|nr:MULTISPECIES: glycerol kinase GlpK [Corynebacterium]AKE40098.1 glycerol kinase [Corynebacterium camporealensis]AVH89175.1 Glycerol kinase [Corynebacterium camporealensis]MDY5841211.1 glycerol kinase GlpK [Corynebacterium camporealensis]QCB29384.1 Glycerol kinase [Corynebacterium endometrii]